MTGPGAVGGKVGGGLYFFSSGTFVRVPNAPNLNFTTTGGFAIDAWVYAPPMQQATDYQPILEKVDPVNAPTGYKGYRLYIINGSIRFSISDGLGGATLGTPPVFSYGTSYQHIVAQMQPNGALEIYHNGTLVASGAGFGGGSFSNSADLLLGGLTSSGFSSPPSIGKVVLDEVELFARPLTPQEIQAIYNSGSVGKCKCATVSNEQIACNPNGTFSYTATLTNVTNAVVTGINLVPPAGVTITPSSITTPLSPGQSVTGTVTISGPNAQPGSTVCFDIVLTTQGVVTCQTKHCVTLPTCPGPGPCVQAPAGMVGWWPLDETSGTTANDLAGVPNNGTHVNGPTPTPGKVAGALRFDGVNDHVLVPDHPDLNVGTGDFTLDAWVRTQASSGVVVLVDKRSGPIPKGYSLFLVNGQLGFQMANGVGISTCAPSPATGVACVNYGAPPTSNVADGQWHHVAVVVDRSDATSGVRLYVDGALVFTGAPMVAPLPDNLDNTSDLYLGMRTPAQQGGGFFPGDLDEVELFKRALTQQEIQTIFQAGAAGKCKPQPGQTGGICVAKFEDLDGDGVQDSGESLLPGWMFNVTDQNNNPVGTITTTPPGTPPACLSVAAPATLTVTEQVQSGWTPTTPNPQTVTVQPGQTANVTFGNQGKAEICIFKFHDLNGDGKQDPNEPPLAGWQFAVSPAPLPPTTSPVTTGSQGSICFGVTAPGMYTITETVQSGWTVTTANPQTVNVSPGQLANVFFGNKKKEPEPTADLGDAPDSTNHPGKAMDAYPSVPAKFPTVFDPTTGAPQGPKHLQPKGLAWLGPDFSFENEADLLPDADGVTNIDPSTNAADRDKFDDGVVLPIAIPFVCGQTQVKYTVTSTQAAKLYVNVWFDFNRDGDWDDPIQKCPLGPAVTGSFTEWAVQNDLITVSGPGTFTFTTPVFGAANPTKGADMWMRITLTDQPIAPANGADGSGPSSGYQYGETEDYLLKLQYTELCGIKFNDLNGNGKQDANEPGLAGWTIEVKDANGNIIGYAVTDAQGRYCVVVPVPGTYTVSEQQQQGWTQTAPAAGSYTVTVPPAHTNLNFGNKKKEEKAEICVFKFEDLDGDGVKDPNEPLLGGWQFNVNPAPLPPATSPVTTLPGGGICFGVSAPGTYTITEQVQSGWTVTTANPQTVNVSPGQLVNVFFGNKKKEEGKCDLMIRKSVNPNPVQSGQQVTVTLTVQNVGTGACGPDTVVQDPPTSGLNVPSQTVAISQSGGTATWGCPIFLGGVNCVTASTLPVGYSATFTFTANVTAPPGSQIQNCATVNNPNDTNPANNQSCVTINVTGLPPPPDLALAKLLDGQLRVEQEATYVLRITNVGQGPPPSPIIVSDPLPSQLRFVSASGSGWSCAAAGQNVTCKSVGPIQPGQTSSILLRVRVAAPAGTQITNCAIVETAGDANPANNRACHTGTVQR